MKMIKSIELFYQEGSSDKVYNAAIVAEDDGTFTVHVEWGRRGSSLNRGTKAVKTTRDRAEQAYERVVRQKTGKGYEEVTDAVQPAAVSPPAGEGSGSKAARRPGARARLGQAAQLLNPVEKDAADALLSDEGVVAQQKLDGVRLLAHIGEEGVVVTNRQGQVTSAAPAVIAALETIDAGTILDGELVAGDYHLFDILADGGLDLREEGYLDRLDCLEELADSFEPPLRLVQTAHTPKQRRALFARLQQEGAEGIVFKRADAPYRPGRPASGGDQLKHKFVKSADVVILENAGNAYLMGVHDDGELCSVGKVFAGTTNETRRQLDAALAEGEHPVAEVRYLYATDDRQLYQPVFCQLRQDKEPADCLLSQLELTSRDVVEVHGAGAGAAPGTSRAQPAPLLGHDWTLEVLSILGAICRR